MQGYYLARRNGLQGFTLIELSIVLVIIGLIVGGVLVGQNLISAAEVRAQITQIEKYNAAVNTFRSKFNSIPGDMDIITAQQFGFTLGSGCTGGQGARDGNGLLDGHASPNTLTQGRGEVLMFWADLSVAGLIDGTFPNSGSIVNGCQTIATALTTTPGTAFIGDIMPSAKAGGGNFVYVYSTLGSNWFGVSALTSIAASNATALSNVTIAVAKAFRMDSKIGRWPAHFRQCDDLIPQWRFH